MTKHATIDAQRRAFDILCPLHVEMDGQGIIQHVGPTMAKLRHESLIGLPFWHEFELIRPKKILTVRQVKDIAGQRLHLRFRNTPKTPLKGEVAVAGEAIVCNLSFAFGLVDAVRNYGLTSGDFASTDLAIEMLYLMEAKSAALEEVLELTKRLRTAEKEAQQLASTDQLTGLANRRAMSHVLLNWVQTRRAFACMHLDLDYFKAVNDTYGHAAGDKVLQRVADVLNSETRQNDIVARVGGDEFVLLLDGITDQPTLDRVAERIIEKLEVPVAYEGQLCQISGSAGTTVSTRYPKPSPDTMLNDADIALYASKEAGRGRHTFFDDQLALTTH